MPTPCFTNKNTQNIQKKFKVEDQGRIIYIYIYTVYFNLISIHIIQTKILKQIWFFETS